MSRCFAFDSIAYLASKKGTSIDDDALIVSIKLQEERKNTIPDRVREEKVKSSDKKKDRKRDKKEKKKDRKDKKRDDEDKIHSVVESEKQKQKQQLTDESFKVGSFGKELISKSSTEVLERSNLTEEHGRPVDTQNVSCSSDSTGNSGKRKRPVDTYSSPASSIQGNGNIIRIRLSSQKRDDPSKSQAELRPLPKTEPSICHAEAMPKVQEPSHAASTSASTLHLVSGVDNLRPSHGKNVESLPPNDGPSTSGRVESKELPPKKLSSHEKKMLKRESLYNKLFQNLVPPGLATELLADQVDDDDDWLFGKKDEEKPAKKLRGDDVNTSTCMDNLPCLTSTLLQPRAHFLSDVGVYALPFTVPF